MKTALLMVLWLLPLHSADPAWKTATVLHARYEFDRLGPPSAGADMGSRGGGGAFIQGARGEFDLEADDVIYTVEETVAPHMRLKIAEGDTVSFAVDGKKLLLRTQGTKVRKLKIIATHPKTKSLRDK